MPLSITHDVVIALRNIAATAQHAAFILRKSENQNKDKSGSSHDLLAKKYESVAEQA